MKSRLYVHLHSLRYDLPRDQDCLYLHDHHGALRHHAHRDALLRVRHEASNLCIIHHPGRIDTKLDRQYAHLRGLH